jgi:hypothetical protein
MVGGLRHLEDAADVDDGLALGDQLLRGQLLRRSLRLELADDLLESVSDSFHAGVPGPVWPDEDSHSPWTDSQGLRHGHQSRRIGRSWQSGSLDPGSEIS